MGGGSGDAVAGAVTAAEDQYADARISVWWDYENCAVPRGCDANRIAQNIKSALASIGYKGQLVDIKAYCDTNKISNTVQQALSSTGVSLNHVPAGIKDASDKKILVDMIFWAVDNPPPANYLLISGDRDFSYALHRLRMKGYNILLAHAPNVSEALVAAAKVIWQWKNLVVGKSPVGTLSSSEKLGESISDAGQITQSGNPPTLCLVNQDITNNGKDDKHLKWKEVKRLTNQGQENTTSSDIPVNNRSTEKPVIIAKQASSVSDAVVTVSNQRANYSVESNQITFSETSSSVTQEVSNAIHIIHPSVAPLSFPPKPPNVGRHPLNENNFKEAPHQFFQVNKLTPPARSLPSSSRPNSSSSMNNGSHLAQNFIPQYPLPLKPSDLLPSQPNTLSGNLSSNSQKFSVPSARPNAHPFTTHQTPIGSPQVPLVPPGSLTDSISRLHISQHSSNGLADYHNSSYIQQNPNSVSFVSGYPNNPRNAQKLYHDHNQRPPVMNGSMSSSGPRGMMGNTSHADEESLIGSILNALCMLKAEKLAPTEANIADCIRYGEMNIKNFNIQAALHFSIQRQLVVMHRMVNNLPFFILKNDALWKCVNIMDATVKYPMSAWDAILKFLYTEAGFSSIMASECKYHAAVILKKSCLPHLVMGDVLQILHVMIIARKWIIPHSSGWQPLSLHLPESDKNSKVGASIYTPNQTVKKC